MFPGGLLGDVWDQNAVGMIRLFGVPEDSRLGKWQRTRVYIYSSAGSLKVALHLLHRRRAIANPLPRSQEFSDWDIAMPQPWEALILSP